MRRRLHPLALALVSLPLLGMGALGGGDTSGSPPRNFEATFVDRDGTRVTAAWVTAGSGVALEGRLGRGTVTVAFDDIRAIEFKGDGKTSLVAHVKLRKGDDVDLQVRSSLSFSGRTALRVYTIRARDLQALEFAAESGR